MKLKIMGFGILLLLIMGICVVSAVTVTNPVINPTGDLTAGTNVSVSFKIDMTPAGGLTFPQEDTLQIFTDLNSPQWTTTIIRDGVNHPQPQDTGHSVYMSGWILSYPSSVQESVQVMLEGSVPSVPKSMNKTIVLVQELDPRNTLIPASIITQSRLIVNPTDLAQSIGLRESDLRVFRTHIDNMTQNGVNTSAAEQNFAAAQSAILAAKSANFATAQAYLNNATSLMDEGEKLMDLAWTEKEISNAQAPISQTSDLITFFTVNRSITNDPRLAIVIAKKESADQYLSSAKDLFAAGNFAFARVKAHDAFAKGNESLNDAINFRLELTKTGGSTGGGNWLNTTTLIIIGVVVVIIAIGGYFLLKKKNRWEDN
ncbi:MAG: LPXTG cell wall anchor domain-containing protein [Methanoregula sp.]|nr:LPXTG cell wall anchor domain-containing protein [Methanoregula sp.]